MNLTLAPGPRFGAVKIPASKSQAHRLLICAALGRGETELVCDGISRDIAATAECLRALGSEITIDGSRIRIRPIERLPEGPCALPCGESGSTLRFLLPVVGALGAEAIFLREGRLPERPLAPLDDELRAHGMSIESRGKRLSCSGALEPGFYALPGNVSSQYISGLLMALPLLNGESCLRVSGRLESAAYVTMTEDALHLSGIVFERADGDFRLPGGQRPNLPGRLQVEGDYSNAAFFLCMGALSDRGLRVDGLSAASSQGDRAVLDILERFGAELRVDGDAVRIKRGELRGCEIDAAPIPDLIPVLSVVAALAAGETRVVNAARLRLKESDRLRSTANMLGALGGEVEELSDGLVIHGRPSLCGGTVDACGDHRIAMAAATAACACVSPVTVIGAECVEKSYPRFWRDFEGLEGERP